MQTYRIVSAESSKELRANLRVRRNVFHLEEGIIPGLALDASVEYDDFDPYNTTLHFNVMVKDAGRREEVGGGSRVIQPNLKMAKATGGLYGLPLEKKVHIDLSAIALPQEVGQVGCVCIGRRWRRTPALPALIYTMGQRSLERGVRYWISSANMGCDSEESASILHNALAGKVPMRSDIPMTVKGHDAPGWPPRFPFFRSDEERQRAARGALGRLPEAISVDMKFGAEFIGPPLWDEHFGMYSLALVSSVEVACKRAASFLRAA